MVHLCDSGQGLLVCLLEIWCILVTQDKAYWCVFWKYGASLWLRTRPTGVSSGNMVHPCDSGQGLLVCLLEIILNPHVVQESEKLLANWVSASHGGIWSIELVSKYATQDTPNSVFRWVIRQNSYKYITFEQNVYVICTTLVYRNSYHLRTTVRSYWSVWIWPLTISALYTEQL